MANGKFVDQKTLNGWKQNFRSNSDLPFTTNAASVSLDQLENFIQEAKAKYSSELTGFRVYPIRYELKAGGWKPGNIQEAGRNLSQPSFVLVPVRNYDPSKGSGDDFVLDNPGDLYVLSFSNPEDPGDSTALCPPKCG